MRKTKIVCTLGPSTDKDGVLENVILAGMNVARFNFSHGSHEEHLLRINKVYELREKLGLPVAALLDTKGPEIRTGKFKNDEAFLESGQPFILKITQELGDTTFCGITYEKLHQDVKKGDNILIDDGLIDMVVDKIEGTDIFCKVIHGGRVANNKGVNVPGVTLSLPYLSEKDVNDIIFGIKQNVDFIAASFTRDAKDIMDIKAILKENNAENIKIIAKIENEDGIKNIDEIIEASDGIMVARGDMGVEIAFEEIPILQKIIIEKTRKAGKQVITATQMLDSMQKNPRPTRAEVTDVANAIFDGTSAIMLSGETAAGKFPVESVETMSVIAERAEKNINYCKDLKSMTENISITDAISHSTCTTASDINAKAIVTVTKSGFTANMISKYKPFCPIIACTTDEKVYRQVALSWGVIPVMISSKSNYEDLFTEALSVCENKKILQKGDVVAITAGVPVGISGTTNLLKVSIIGDNTNKF
ncbi:MAG: pyruvate kinase [Oscillospiraceae bacterium]